MPELDNAELEQWMQVALKLAAEAEKKDEVPIGCVFVHDGKLLTQGMNLREETHRTTAHAEIVALETYNANAKSWRLPPNTSVIVTAEPCPMCTCALIWARADNIYFGCADTKNAGLLRLSPLIEAGTFDHRFNLVRGGILETECAAIMKNYFKAKRK